MARKNLTEKRINAFTSDGKQQKFLWDANTPGLGLRATKNGAKAFVYQGNLAGQDIRITIGNPKSWSIDEARKEARRIQILIDQNIDPRQEKRKKQQAIKDEKLNQHRRVITIAQAWDSYIEERRKVWSENTLSDHMKMMKPGGEPYKHHNKENTSTKRTQPGILSPLGKLRLYDLTPDVVISWLKKEREKRPTQTALAFRLLRGFVNWCSEDKLYSQLAPAEAINSKKVRENVPKQGAKKDVLEKEQLEPWFREIKKLNPIISAYLQTMLITGARREEILTLQWQNIDFKWSQIDIKDKVDGRRTIPLTPYVKELLSQLPRTNEWVFSSPRSKSGRLMEPNIAHNKAVKAAKVNHLTIHGLRRSFVSLANWVSLPKGIVYQIAGHKPSATAERHYEVRPIDILRYWHTKYEAWILEQAGIEFSETYKGDKVHTIAPPDQKPNKTEAKKSITFKVIE
ncbi:tyrosine-type recombinase/integrase [Halomonas heilongjiangensis]|uniref:Preprotein translocase n=1 Tax=Halomonas heilongjiangensis TaxID=1387883 RepID=A0A2N7TMZ6_9GAMM|nr:integrase family protein [Halomonas heilongjiangensis]PMR69498.1 preprotein translocase [Halomonas heilongjiangensis]PXX89968.1 preprotein translocase [Halomonas heilongjiangensis]